MADDPRPFISIDPAVKFGRPTVGGSRVSVDMIAQFVAGGSIDEVLADYDLTRADVIVACWYAGVYGTTRYRRLWGDWAKQVAGDLWSSRYDVPDPPESL